MTDGTRVLKTVAVPPSWSYSVQVWPVGGMTSKVWKPTALTGTVIEAGVVDVARTVNIRLILFANYFKSRASG